MSIFLPHYFEELKNCTLLVAGIANVTPSDCKELSHLILLKTRQRISETTLKRVFGFAYSKFKPSVFTVETLSQFCGHNSWNSFCESREKKNAKKTGHGPGWDVLKQNAGKITNFTLQALKNRSGIPYNQTIKRQFLDDHFDAFLSKGETATVIVAPAGYGKTVALCHWVEDRLELNAEGKANDIIIFFSSSALINVFLSGRDINEWLLTLLGYSNEEDISWLLHEKAGNGDGLLLVIDGFDDHMFKADQFRMVLNQLTDILALYRGHPCFKLVLTMRLASWINYKHEFDIVENNWFMGFPKNGHPVINVPLFNTEEITSLSKKINPAAKAADNNNIATGKFNHPLYFQFYYKDHKENFSLDHIDHICIYDLISTFILNKVYLGSNSADKMLLLKELEDAMDFANKQYAVSKLKVNHLIKQYNAAYQDLINAGFLREQNKSSNLEHNVFIEFSNTDFLEYSIAKKLLLDNNFIFNSTLIKKLNNLYHDDAIKLPVLKWVIIYALKSEQESELKSIAGIELLITEKADLIVFLAELLEKECIAVPQSETIKNYLKQNCIKDLFDYFIGIEFVDPEYEKTLHILLKFELSNPQKIIVYSVLAIISIIKLDLNKLEEHLLRVRKLSNNNYTSFPINPLNCLDTLFYYLRYGIIKKESLTEITRFCFNAPKRGSFEDTPSNDIIFIMAVYATIICNPQKGLRLINVLNDRYKPIDPSSGYGFFMSIAAADRYFRKGETNKGVDIYNSMVAVYNSHENMYTPIMQSLFIALRVKVSLFSNDFNNLEKHFNQVMAFTTKTNYNLSRMYVLAFLLNNNYFLSEHEDFEKQVQYDFRKILRELDINPELFLKPVYNNGKVLIPVSKKYR
ncbi:MAG: hypothetical protein EOP47_18260 [Sphingobacteriaceae bacterium]|nr:MAG: hypothetical protein EOP47_18260 [Sphingobacteriaceae bacterium]